MAVATEVLPPGNTRDRSPDVSGARRVAVTRTRLSVAILCALAPIAAFAQSDAERIAALERRVAELERLLLATTANAKPADTAPPQRLDQLEQDVRVVQRKLELKDEESTAALANTPVVTAGEKGFSLASRDGRFNLRLRGLIHADSRDYVDDETLAPGVDGFQLRRVRPIVEGTLFGIYDYRFTPDFAGSRVVTQDAYIDARFDPRLKLRVGKFKTPFGIERLQSASDMRFVERGLPNNLVPNRDLGVQLHGDLFGGKLGYAVGVFNGVLDGGSSEASNDAENNGDKDIAARLFAQPFLASDNFALRGLGLGIAATYVDQRADSAQPQLPGYRTPGQLAAFAYRTGATATYADGQRLRWSPQLSYYYGSFGVLGEYVRVKQDVSRRIGGTLRRDGLEHDAWQLSLNYVITGEEASYGSIKPKAPFSIGSAGWGAWEAVARVGALDLDTATFTGGSSSYADPASAIQGEDAWSVGINWYLNRNLRWSFDYEQARFEGGAAADRDRADEKIAFSRFQIAF